MNKSMNKTNVALRCALVFLITTVTFGTLGIVLIFEYNNTSDWNANSQKTVCQIDKYKVKHTTCGRSSRDCYDGYVIYAYNDTKDKYHYFTDSVGPSEDSKDDTLDYLKTNYPIGKRKNCYYNKDDYDDVAFEHKDPVPYLISSIVFFSVWFIIIMIYVMCEMTIDRIQHDF